MIVLIGDENKLDEKVQQGLSRLGFKPSVHPYRLYGLALEEAGFKATNLWDVDLVCPNIVDKFPNHGIEMVIFQIMMPPGQTYGHHKDVEDGLKTGVFLYRDLRRLLPRVPMIVLANMLAPETLFEREPLLETYEMVNVLPYELVEIVQEMLKGDN